MVPAPEEYVDLILVPQYLHIDPLAFADYPPMLQARIRRLLMRHIGAGWAGNPALIVRESDG